MKLVQPFKMYYPTEEEEFELMCDDELEIEKEIEQGRCITMNNIMKEVNLQFCLHQFL